MSRNPLVIFDCDGVLVDSERVASAVFAEHLCQFGLAYTAQDCAQLFTGLSLESCGQLLAEKHGVDLPVSFFAKMQVDTFARFSQTLHPVEGIHAVLDFLDGGCWQYCVASSGSYEKMHFTLGHTGLLKRMSGRLYSASDVARGKPAPDLFMYAAKQQQRAPAHCVVIEDAWPGVQAAHAAGMRVCAFGAQHAKAARQMPDTVAFTDMSELPAILSNMLRS